MYIYVKGAILASQKNGKITSQKNGKITSQKGALECMYCTSYPYVAIF